MIKEGIDDLKYDNNFNEPQDILEEHVDNDNNDNDIDCFYL